MVKLLDKDSVARIAEAIRKAEAGTCGEIKAHVKRGATKDALQEARKIFKKTGMHRTKLHTGVLIFVSWGSRSFAIVGDEGIHRKTGDAFWNSTRDAMQKEFEKGDLAGGIVEGVRRAGEELRKYFPLDAEDKNELPDTVTEEN